MFLLLITVNVTFSELSLIFKLLTLKPSALYLGSEREEIYFLSILGSACINLLEIPSHFDKSCFKMFRNNLPD